MTPTRLATHTCRNCGKPLTDAVSRRFRIGPDCRKGMTGDQLRTAADLTKEEAKPGYIPPTRHATTEARMTNAAARHVVQQATTPGTCKPHGGLIGQCPLCKRDGDPTQIADRVIREIQAERRAARDGATP